MRIRHLICVLIFVGCAGNAVGETGGGNAQKSASENAKDSLKKAIWLLEQTPSGKEELAQAKSLNIPIEAGTVSKTEITATRTQSASEEDSYKILVHVLIAREKDPVFQALDLAHELTHAIHPKENPFDPKLDPTQYVKDGIQGKGGEAPAIAQECKVGKELTDLPVGVITEETAQLIKARCSFVWKTEADASKWNQSFYYLGQYYHDFISLLKKTNVATNTKIAWVNQIEEKSPMFASAVAHKPYPLALLEEYMQITRIVCEKTMKSVASQLSGRTIASLSAFQTAMQIRCRGFGRKDDSSATSDSSQE